MKTAGAMSGLVLGNPVLWAQQTGNPPKTNIQDALDVKRIPRSLPGAFPGRIIQTHHPTCL